MVASVVGIMMNDDQHSNLLLDRSLALVMGHMMIHIASAAGIRVDTVGMADIARLTWH